ncbi:MAG TPA: alkaline phosphatase family protein [Baekduia sp.]|nr:alkaline phosphatase family protein [Baekduia sp.]
MPHLRAFPSRAAGSAVLAALLLLAALTGCASAAPPKHARRAAAFAPPPVRHVFVVVLENENAATTFGRRSKMRFLARRLVRRGAFLPQYYGVAHASLPNYLAMVSGQAPNPATQVDCPVYTDVQPGTSAADGQVLGSGCVYPASVRTIADQLEATGRTWKAYNEDMGDDRARDGGATCAHPALGSPDTAFHASARDQYATRHNPFVYFHAITDRAACAQRDVSLRSLAHDLRRRATTPNFAFVTPDLCHDGHDRRCADGGPGGPAGVQRFLRRWVPRITRSPAYRRDGLLAILFDEAEHDARACCAEPTGPNTDRPGSYGPGGGRTGAVLLSRFIRPGTRTSQAYNHYSFLRSLEDLFGLAHLGFAGADGLRPFGRDVYTRPRGR